MAFEMKPKIKTSFKDSSELGKRGQVAIWIIIAIVVVSVIGLFYVLRIGPGGIITQSQANPETFIKGCVRDLVKEKVDEILPRGGLVNNRVSIEYNNKSVEYLCKTSNYYEPCINQHPAYLKESNTQLTDAIGDGVEQCFVELEDNLKERGVSYTGEGENINLKFAPGRIFVEIDKRVIIDGENGIIIDGFNIEVASPIYDLMTVAIEIANQESQYCYFNTVGYGLFYPKYEIEKSRLNDNSLIYKIKDISSNKILRIATRGCVLPPGIG